MGRHRDQASIIRAILEGTAGETGQAFFAALVRNVAAALGVAGAWVTEYLAGPRRLRALAFWFENRFVPDYEYAIAGTTCEPVIDGGRLLHLPDNIVDLCFARTSSDSLVTIRHPRCGREAGPGRLSPARSRLLSTRPAKR
jgi:hypothetical protein